ncbi:MAG: cupin domain-containing protein [Desulfobacterales bacterium]
MKLLTATVILLSAFAPAASGGDIPQKGESQRISITRSGSQPSTKGSDEYFTGSVRIDSRFQQSDPARVGGGIVTFDPGARTAWHTHPLGQTLIITAGTGLIRQWGNPIQEMKQGDVVWIPPDVRHWHGAAETAGMTHIAIAESLEGKAVQWMEKVSDEQYRR